MIPIFIPSMGRADDRVLRGPAAQLPPEVRGDVYYVVPDEEHTAYERALSPVGARVIVCGRSGIAATRKFIGEYAYETGNDKFVMCDDDIGFLVRRSSQTWQLRGSEPHEVVEAFDWVERALDTHAHVSLSAREGNNRGGVGGVSDLVSTNTRTLRVLAYRTQDFLSVEHGRVEVMEDFDVNLQLLRQGKSNAVSFYYAQGQRMTNEAGGCSTYRTHAVHEASARRLAELHPGLVRLRQKVNKTDREGFGSRLEVVISWKKAFQNAQT